MAVSSTLSRDERIQSLHELDRAISAAEGNLSTARLLMERIDLCGARSPHGAYEDARQLRNSAQRLLTRLRNERTRLASVLPAAPDCPICR